MRSVSRFVVWSLLASSAVACKKPEAEPTPPASVAPAALPAPAPAPAPAGTNQPRVYTAAQADEMMLQWEMDKVKVPEDNPQSTPKVELGHQLFFDKRLSGDGSRSCYSCHSNEHGNGGSAALETAPKGKKLTRHSPSIWNVGLLSKLFWDGRVNSLEAQASEALEGELMGLGRGKLAAKAAELGKIPGYKELFQAAFPGEGATAKNVTQALAAYERTLVCNDTPFDKYGAGDKHALTDDQKHGYMIFTERAKCDTCHQPPYFSNAFNTDAGNFFNIGIGTENKAEASVDVGRMAVTQKDTDWAAFKPPSLRNVSNSAPYFHDGSRATLEEAVRFMAGGGHENKNRTPVMVDKKLSDEEVRLIVAFLGSLSCNQQLEVPKKLP